MELTQKTKPVIIISLHEIAQTHRFLLQNIDKLAKDKEDPLRLILADLGEAPEVSKEDDREIQLTLTNRFKQNMEGMICSILYPLLFFRGDFGEYQPVCRNQGIDHYNIPTNSIAGQGSRSGSLWDSQ